MPVPDNGGIVGVVLAAVESVFILEASGAVIEVVEFTGEDWQPGAARITAKRTADGTKQFLNFMQCLQFIFKSLLHLLRTVL